MRLFYSDSITIEFGKQLSYLINKHSAATTFKLCSTWQCACGLWWETRWMEVFQKSQMHNSLYLAKDDWKSHEISIMTRRCWIVLKIIFINLLLLLVNLCHFSVKCCMCKQRWHIQSEPTTQRKKRSSFILKRIYLVPSMSMRRPYRSFNATKPKAVSRSFITLTPYKSLLVVLIVRRNIYHIHKS